MALPDPPTKPGSAASKTGSVWFAHASCTVEVYDREKSKSKYSDSKCKLAVREVTPSLELNEMKARPLIMH